jgi:transposase
MVQRNPWGGPGVMIWGGMAGGTLVGPVIFQNVGPGRGNGVNANRYVQQVLIPHVAPFFARRGNFIFQQDNATAHTARVTQHYLQQNNIAVIPWPAQSPDLNPIEHLWDELQRRLNRRQPRPATAAQLGQAIVQEWGAIPRVRILRLVSSVTYNLKYH